MQKLQDFKDALFSFSANTGLSWDEPHPRALLRLPDELLRDWMAFFEKCDFLGSFPTKVGTVIAVLLPKQEGGFRPIGLLPFAPRVWMRLRREHAKRWEELQQHRQEQTNAQQTSSQHPSDVPIHQCDVCNRPRDMVSVCNMCSHAVCAQCNFLFKCTNCSISFVITASPSAANFVQLMLSMFLR